MLNYYRIINSDRPEDRFNTWQKFRIHNTKFITNVISKYRADAKKLLIIGAGNCDDIDLQELKDKELFYLDIDIKSVKEGIKRQDLQVCNKNLIQLDLTGFEYISLYNRLMRSDNILDIKDLLRKQASDERFRDIMRTKIGDINQKFDVIIFMPIFTQLSVLTTNLLSQKFPFVPERDIIGVYEIIEPAVISNIRLLLDHICKKDTVNIGISDLIQINAFGQGFCEKFLDDFFNYSSKGDYFGLMAKYKNYYTVGAAVYHSLFTDDTKKIRVIYNDIWEFNKEKQYYTFSIAKIY